MNWLTHRPLGLFSASFVIGSAFETLLPERTEIAYLAFTCVVITILFAFFTSKVLRLFLLTSAFFAFGIWFTRLRLPSVPSPLSAPFEGIVASEPLQTRHGYKVLLKLREADGFVQLWVLSENLPQWQVGKILRVHQFRGRVTKQRRLRLQHVLWIGTVKGDFFEEFGESDEFKWSKVRQLWQSFVFERWRHSLPIHERTVTFSTMASIVFGMRTTAISETDKQAFVRSGLAHLFVPSGSQVTLLMGIAWVARRFLGLPSFPLLALLLGFYIPLTRSEPSIFRAVLMGVYAFIGWRWWRDVDWYTALWLSSALLIAFDPSMLHDVGFQLSYSATFGLLYSSSIFVKMLTWMPDWLRYPFAMTISAQVFLLPVLMHYFGRISLISPLANLCAAIPASIALTLGFVSALLSTISPKMAMPVSIVAGELAKFVVRLAHWFATPSWASINLTPLSGWQTLSFMSVLIAVTAWVNYEQTSKPSNINN